MKKITLLIVSVLLFQLHLFSQNTDTEITNDINLHNLLLAIYPRLDFFPSNGGGDGIISEYEAKNYSIPNGVMELHFTNAQSSAGISLTGLQFFNINTLKLISDRQAGELVHGVNLDLENINNGSNLTELYLEKVYIDALDFKHAVNIKNLTFINCSMNLVLDDLPLLGTLRNTVTWDNTANLVNLRIDNSGSFGTLDLSNRSTLKTVDISNVYLTNLNVDRANSDLIQVNISDAQNLASVSLPSTSSNLQYLTIIGLYKALNLASLDLTKQTNLSYLKLSANSPNTALTTLDLSNNTLLTDLILENFDGLTSLNLASNTALINATINYLDNLSSGTIDFSKNTNLVSLICNSNKLTSIDLTNNTKLTSIECQDNQLTGIDVSKNVALTKLDCSSNTINTLDVSANTNLQRLDFPTNALTKLDVHLNSMLNHIDVSNNQLIALNVANGNNINMNSWESETGINALTNPNLRCIVVDDNVINTIPDTWMIDSTAGYTTDNEIAYTDAAFKTALLNNAQVIDVDGNGKISTCEAANFTGKIDVSIKNIANLASIEAFTNLTELDCSGNALTTLDLSSNTKLTYLDCSYNSLTALNTDVLTALTYLDVSHNSIANSGASVMNVDKNIELIDLYCNNNALTGLNIQNNPKLIRYNCAYNQMQHITLTLNSELVELYCNNNPFTSSALIANTIDLTNNTKLQKLDCSGDQLTDLDVSILPALTSLSCSGNALEKLNIANGNNAGLTTFNASNNTALYCIQVDADIIGSIPSSWVVDSIANYSVDACIVLVCSEVNIPDANFKAALLNYSPRIDLDYDGKIEDCEAENVTSLDLSNKNIADLTGIEAFINITSLNVSNNNLTSLDLTLNTKLQTVTVSGNASLTSIILPDGANTSPKGTSNKVSITNSTLTSLDLSNNALTSLDLHNYSKLATIKVNNNNLTYLNVQNGNNQNIGAANFDASGNTGLTEIIVDDIAYATANWPSVDASITFTSSTLGVADVILNTKLSVYPNPTRGLVSIQVSLEYTIENMNIYSVTGKQLRSYNVAQKLIDLRNLSKGVYFIRIKTDKGAVTKKIIKY